MSEIKGFHLASLRRFETSSIAESEYPAIAGLASQIEMFGLSKRELEAKFTKSEMVLLAWRSHEISYNMQKQTDSIKTGGTGVSRQVGGLPDDLPDYFFRKEDDPVAGVKKGELDLRQVTGADAHRLFQKMGIRLPIIQR